MQNKFVQYYDLFFEKINEDKYFYHSFIQENQPALEIGSGTGRLLLNYLKSDLQVEGLEPNTQFIEICKQKAARNNLNPIIYNQKLQDLSIEKKYKTIFMPLYVFQYILSYDDIKKSLKNIYDQLLPNGQVIISIFIPWIDPTGTYEQVWRVNQIRENNNQKIVLTECVSLDKFEQIQTKLLKLEIFENNTLIETHFDTLNLRFYSTNELRLLLEIAGFKNLEVYGDYVLQEPDANTQTFIFVAKKYVE